jgi:hypothetical protein
MLARKQRTMNEVTQPGWTRLRTVTGRYEYQFQGEMPTVRGGQYEAARDYQFLVLDEEGWLYKIPVRLADEAASELVVGAVRLRVAEAQLRAGLETYRPRQGAPYPEMDAQFALSLERARELADKLSSLGLGS